MERREPLKETTSGVPMDVLFSFACRTNIRHFEAGSVLMRQGDISDCMHVIISGRVRVEREEPNIEDPILLAELGPGEIVGEMGVVLGAPRSATVTAMEDIETMELQARSRVSWKRLPVPREQATPLLNVVGRRLEMNRLVAEAVRRHKEQAEATVS